MDTRIAATSKSPDIEFSDCGTVWVIRARTDSGREWLAENVSPVEAWEGSQDNFVADW